MGVKIINTKKFINDLGYDKVKFKNLIDFLNTLPDIVTVLDYGKARKEYLKTHGMKGFGVES